MELTDKQLVRIAETIRDQLRLVSINHYREIQRLIYTIVSHQEQLEMIRRGLDKSVSRNWTSATNKLNTNIERIVRDIPYAVNELERAAKHSHTKMPTPRLLYEDLKQVQEEFGRLQYNTEEQILSVFTDAIELEEIFLGDFEVQLQITKMAEMKNNGYLRVIALDPHPAATNDCVTHPHVSDEYLCAGDASVPMQSALANGRICDFFMLVRSVLETYNPSSPYVSLSEWDGIACYDCGYVVSGDDSYYCESCDNSYCDECMSYCVSCDTSLCRGCLTSCQFCEEPCCQECLKVCSECEESGCSSCIEDDLCPTCKEKQENQENENETNESKETEPQVA